MRPLPAPIPDDLVKELTRGNCVAIVGAGLSMAAGLPSWPALLRNLLDWASKNASIPFERAELERAVTAGEYLLVAEELRETMGEKNRYAGPGAPDTT